MRSRDEIYFQEGRPMIITITLNAALDRTQRIENPLQVGKLNRAVSSHLEPGGKGINVSRAIKALGGSNVRLASVRAQTAAL